MTLKATLNESADLFRLLRVHAPQVRDIARETNKIIDKGGTIGQEVSVAHIQEKLVAAFKQGKLANLNRRELRQAPRGFFDGSLPIAIDAPLRENVLQLIGSRRQKSAVLASIFQYLEWFDPHNEALKRVGEWLDDVVRIWQWPWHDRAIRYQLFKVSEAPSRLAESVLSNGMPVDRVLEEIGLNESSVTGKMVEFAFAEACNDVSQADQNRAVVMQERLIAWANRSSRFSYENRFVDYAKALLEPWHNLEPTEAHRRVIIGELLEFAGDPRVRPAKWKKLNEDTKAYAVLLRWLTKVSVYQFFDIVDRVTDNEIMWKFRRAFWTAYLEAGHIEQAWVVFGASGQRLARQLAKESDDKGLMYFGKLAKGGSRSPNHTALVMKIGDLTIAEWSHNGKYNIWKKNDTGAPKLFQDYYQPDDLRLAPIDGSHTSSENFGWQRTVAAIIKDETGRSTPTSDWQPNVRRRSNVVSVDMAVDVALDASLGVDHITLDTPVTVLIADTFRQHVLDAIVDAADCPYTCLSVEAADGAFYALTITNHKIPGGLPLNPNIGDGFSIEHAPGWRGLLQTHLNIETDRCKAYIALYQAAFVLSNGSPIEARGDKRVIRTLQHSGYLVHNSRRETFAPGPAMKKHFLTKLSYGPLGRPDDSNPLYQIRILRLSAKSIPSRRVNPRRPSH